MQRPPAPTEHHLALARLEGLWRGLEPAPDDGEAAIGTYDNRFILGGFVMALDYTQMMGGHARYRMHSLIGWDSPSERYFFHWYDSLGGVGADIFGAFDGDQLILEGPDPVQGGRARFTWTLADDAHEIAIEFSRDRETWTRAMHAEYRRVQ